MAKILYHGSRVQIARLEVFTWQKVSSALAEAAYISQKSSEKKWPKLNIQEPIPATTKSYVTVKEACLFLGISRSTLYRLMSEGHIPYTKIGGHATRYNLQELEAYARKHTVVKAL